MNGRQAAWILALVGGLSLGVAGGDLSANAVTASLAAHGIEHPSLVVGAKLQCGTINGQRVCLTGKQLEKILKNQPQSGQQKDGKGKGGKNKNESKGKNKNKDKDKDKNKDKDKDKDEDKKKDDVQQGQTEVCCTIQVTEANGSPAPSPAYVQCRTTEAAARQAAATFADNNSFRVTSTSCQPRAK